MSTLIRNSVFSALKSGPLAPDLGGTATTEAFTEAVLRQLDSAFTQAS
ncbi:MAG: hypothetical protein AAF629_04510 [Chloroflexota bacterium]